MISLNAKINLFSQKDINEVSSEKGNNISGEIPIGKKSIGSNPFLIGASRLDEGDAFGEKTDFYIGKELSDKNGKFSAAQNIDVIGLGITNFAIMFDNVGGQHPTSVKLTSYRYETGAYPSYTDTDLFEYGVGVSSGVISVEDLGFDGSTNEIISAEAYLSDASLNADLVEYYIKDGKFYWEADLYFEDSYIVFNANFIIRTLEEIGSSWHFDDDSIYLFDDLPSNAMLHRVQIEEWSKPFYPIRVLGIYTEIEILIDKRNMISVSCSLFDRSDTKLPSYGIISNSGEIEFNDLDGEIRDCAEQMLLTSDLKVKININNTLSKNSGFEQIGEFETRNWDYDSNNRKVSVSLKDDLEEWQDIENDGFSYDPRKPYSVLHNGTMADLYKWLEKETPSKYKMLSFDNLDDETKEILNSTKIKYPLLKNGTLWRQWQKLCEVCGLYIFKNNNGETVCSHTLGS